MSEFIGKYRIITDFTTSGGGQCRWAFAVHGGKEYFIKEFLSPTYPLPDSPGSKATKERKLRKCEQFEKHHREITKTLNRLSKPGGNLVITQDFFRHGAKYYKVTEKIDTSALSLEEIAAEPMERRLLMLITVTHSLKILHQAGLVHGDIKPENILIKGTVKNYHTAKLIDFDNAFFSGKPVPPDDMVGDLNYYSPETFGYLNGTVMGEQLTTASDIFALGLVAVQFLTGSLVSFIPVEGAGRYPGELCAAGASYTTGLEEIFPQADSFVRKMLSAEPSKRPTVDQVFDHVKELRSEVKKREDFITTTIVPRASSAKKSRLKGTLLKKSASTSREAEPTPRNEKRSRLRGTLLEKRDSPPA